MLELYQAEGCPYSQQARRTLTDLGLSFVAHNPRTHDGDVTNEQTYEQLQQVSGKDQIPFLVDHTRGVTMFESDDITAYLETHYGEE